MDASLNDGSPSRPSRKPLLAAVIGIAAAVLVLVAVVAVSASASLAQIRTSALTVQRDFARIEAAVDELDVGAARESAESLGSALSSIESQLDGWEWDVLSSIGVRSDDIQGARTLASTGLDLVQNALDPLLDSASDYQEAVDADGLAGLLRAVGSDSAGSAVLAAEPHVRSAQDALSGLGSFSIDELQAAADSLSSLVDRIGSAYDSLDEAARRVGSIADGIESVASAIGLDGLASQ